jgi:hypothetical protein
MKKRVLGLIVGALLLMVPAAVFSQDVNWEGNYEKGDLSVYGGIGIGYGFSIVPGVEFTFAEWKAGDVVPFSFGVTAKGAINIFSNYWTSFGVGGLATLHLGFRGLDIPEFLQNFDVYVSAGLGLSFFNYTGSYSGFTEDFYFGFVTADGVAYFINDKFAVYAEGNYWTYGAGVGGAVLGVLYKF